MQRDMKLLTPFLLEKTKQQKIEEIQADTLAEVFQPLR